MGPWLLAGRLPRRLEYFSEESCTPALVLKPWDHADQPPPRVSRRPAAPPQRSSASPMAIGFAMKVRVGSMGNLNSVPMRR
jgi:hypothetical protein